MARRGSNGVANNDETSQSLSVCNNQLEQLAKTVQNDCKDFPLEIQMEWKQQILLLAKKSAVVNNIANTAKNVRLEMRQRPRPEIAEDRESIEIVKKKMMKSLAERTSAFDANSTQLLRKLAGVLKIGNEEDEEDILLLNEENRESTFRCPYTTVRMVDPMTK